MAKRESIKTGTASLRLISLALALMLEVYFYSQDNSITRRVAAVIQFEAVPSNRLIIEPENNNEGIPANIDITGPRTLVDHIASREQKISIPFPAKAPPVFSVDVSYEGLNLPPRVSIVSARPARVLVRTVELVEKRVPVVVPLTGSSPKNIKLSTPVVSPESIIIKGPSYEVQKISQVELESIDITDIKENFKTDLKVKPLGEYTIPEVNIISVSLEAKIVEDISENTPEIVKETSSVVKSSKKVVAEKNSSK